MGERRGKGVPFRRGRDHRRHELTQAERSRGGQTRWKQISNQWRQSMGLPQLFSDEEAQRQRRKR